MNNIIFILLFYCVYSKLVKNILVVIFPGGKNKNSLMIDLFNYSIEKSEKYDIYYHIIIHESENDIFHNKKYNNINLLPYGSNDFDIEKIDIDDIEKKPIFKFYQIKLRKFYQEFLDSEILNKIKNNIYDMIISDRPNFIFYLLQKELKIKQKLYLSLRPLPQLFYNNIELNYNYIPILGSDNINIMDYSERTFNFFSSYSEKFINFLSNYEIKYLFNDYGFKYIKSNIDILDCFILIQYPIGITFPLKIPFNVKLLNSITLDLYDHNYLISFNKDFYNFIQTYKNIIVFSKDIFFFIEKYIIELIINDYLIDEENQIGFLFINNNENIKLNNTLTVKIKEDEYYKFLNQILKIKQISLLITPSNFNEITNSIYFKKPILSFGNGIYQKNINGYIKRNMLGIIIKENEKANYKNIINSINKLIQSNNDEFENDNIYIKNAIRVSNILKNGKNPFEEYLKWINYGFEIGYQNLELNLYERNNEIFFYNAIIIIIIFIISISILKFFLNKYIFNKNQKTNKTKLKKD